MTTGTLDRKTAILVSQFRAPVFIQAKEPAMLEAIAGIQEEIDAAETARREALEASKRQVLLFEAAHGGHWQSPWQCPGQALSSVPSHVSLGWFLMLSPQLGAVQVQSPRHAKPPQALLSVPSHVSLG